MIEYTRIDNVRIGIVVNGHEVGEYMWYPETRDFVVCIDDGYTSEVFTSETDLRRWVTKRLGE